MKEIYSIITIEDAGGKWFVLQKNNFLWYLLLSFEEKKTKFFSVIVKINNQYLSIFANKFGIAFE